MKVHELLSDPSKWTKGAAARNEQGNPCSSSSTEAVCFCLIGALCVCYNGGPVTFSVMFGKVSNAIPNNDIAEWNDAPERTYEEVINILKELDV